MLFPFLYRVLSNRSLPLILIISDTELQTYFCISYPLVYFSVFTLVFPLFLHSKRICITIRLIPLPFPPQGPSISLSVNTFLSGISELSLSQAFSLLSDLISQNIAFRLTYFPSFQLSIDFWVSDRSFSPQLSAFPPLHSERLTRCIISCKLCLFPANLRDKLTCFQAVVTQLSSRMGTWAHWILLAWQDLLKQYWRSTRFSRIKLDNNGESRVNFTDRSSQLWLKGRVPSTSLNRERKEVFCPLNQRAFSQYFLLYNSHREREKGKSLHSPPCNYFALLTCSRVSAMTRTERGDSSGTRKQTNKQ